MRESYLDVKLNDDDYAPIALFVYNRLDNVREVINALVKNFGAEKTNLYIFSDAPRYHHHIRAVLDVRDYLKTLSGFKNITIIERDRNYYIEKNIIEGVTAIVNNYGKVIVLEDDGVTDPRFIQFMNACLIFYKEVKKVMHISAFTFIKPQTTNNETFFWRYTENTGGGWATWADRWKNFEYINDGVASVKAMPSALKATISLDDKVDFLSTLKLSPVPWDICWMISVAKNKGLAVQSPISLIKNNGLYNGTHFGFINSLFGKSPFEVDHGEASNIFLNKDIVERGQAIHDLKLFYKRLESNKRARAWNYLLKILVITKITKILKFFLNRQKCRN